MPTTMYRMVILYIPAFQFNLNEQIFNTIKTHLRNHKSFQNHIHYIYIWLMLSLVFVGPDTVLG